MMGDRTHLVSAAVEKLLDAAKGSRHAARDRCLLLLMFRHGWRVSEACGQQSRVAFPTERRSSALAASL